MLMLILIDVLIFREFQKNLLIVISFKKFLKFRKLIFKANNLLLVIKNLTILVINLFDVLIQNLFD